MSHRLSPEADEDRSNSPELSVLLPTLTSLQFLVIELLSSESASVSAHHLKLGLAAFAPGYDGPKFYQLMGRLVRDGLVTSETLPLATSGGTVERTFYSPTGRGGIALALARTFYMTRHRLRSALAGQGELCPRSIDQRTAKMENSSG